MKLLFASIFGLTAFLLPQNNVESQKPTNPSPVKDVPCPINNTAFQSGEKFVLKVYYNWTAIWLNAGEVVFKVQEKELNDKPVFHVTAAGQTYKSYEWFYKVKDQYETYLDVNTLKPYKFVRDVNEGGYLIKNIYDFDHQSRKVYTQDLLKTPVEKNTYEIPSCVHDVVSAIYYARNIDFDKYKKDDRIPLSVFIDGEVYNMYIRYMGKETIKTKLGKFRTIKFKPLLLDNEYFEGGEKMIIWVTDDANKIPVRIETPITVGSIKADLMSYSGLKYDFGAKVD